MGYYILESATHVEDEGWPHAKIVEHLRDIAGRVKEGFLV